MTRKMLVLQCHHRWCIDAGVFQHPQRLSGKWQAQGPIELFRGRYVVRGLEAGGAIQALGRYVTFVGEEGERIAYLHPVESIGVNGLHAVVIAPVLVRVDMLRKGQTYEVLITEHKPRAGDNGTGPTLESKVLFRGIHGRIELDLCGKDKAQAGSVLPTFYSLAGEHVPVPKRFIGVLKAASKGANCLHCEHSHYLLRPKTAPRTSAGFAVGTPEVPGSATELAETGAGEHELAS